MGDSGLVARCRSFGVLGAVLSFSGVGLRWVMSNDVGGVLLLAAAFLVVAIVVLIKYLGLLRDLRYAMAVRSGRKPA